MILLSRPLSGRMARVGLSVLLTATITVAAHAQTETDTAMQNRQDYNKELRTRTWSIYAEGGVSWATGVEYSRLNAKRSYNFAPAVGGGIDFNIRPWVRVGVEYLYSRYRREQRFSTISSAVMPAKVYGNYLMNYHNIKLGAGFNLMEFWPKRKAQWFNMYLGTGIGYTMGRGNDYGMWFGTTKTQGGITTPLGSGVINNTGIVIISGTVKTANDHVSYRKFYIPASLNIEADVSRRFTLGVKGEIDWLFNPKDVAPKNLIFALATVRYNFVTSKAQVLKTYYSGRIEELNGRINDLQQQVESEQARAAQAEADRARVQQEAADLQRQLDDCNASKKKTEDKIAHIVPFAHDRADISQAELNRLIAFARSVQGKRLSVVAEASTPGSSDYNQHLSARRLESVIKVLKAEGFSTKDLKPSVAIGEQNGIPNAKGRIVTITVE